MKTNPKLLCVDDEPIVLEGMKMNLRRRFEVLTATSGAAALEVLAREPGVAVVMSDMRMPGMDGATLLSKVRVGWPDTVRLLLTGQADLESAIAAVNEGQIFRFLNKPCPPPALLAALEAAAEQHRLVTAERVLLEQTLHGSIKMLVDVLSLTNPASFGRATRIKQLAGELSTAVGMKDRWQVEVAAMLSELGSITLPVDTVERLRTGQPLTDDDTRMMKRAAEVTDQLLANIPRLEVVREMLIGAAAPPKLPRVEVPVSERTVADLGAQVLKVAADMDALEAQGEEASTCVGLLRSRGARYDPVVVRALEKVRGGANGPRAELREVKLAALRPAMVFARDVRLATGALLVARGYEVTPGFLERLRNFGADTVQEPLWVLLPAVKPNGLGVAA
ncbi:MAG: response regulator [Myxococcales bacterium]|nr:response regulator [Myxococcales bacterium]